MLQQYFVPVCICSYFETLDNFCFLNGVGTIMVLRHLETQKIEMNTPNKQTKHHTLNIPQGGLVNGFEIYSIFSIISEGAIIYLFIYTLIQFLALRHWI